MATSMKRSTDNGMTWYDSQKEIMALLVVVPLTLRELAELRGTYQPPVWQALTRLEEMGYVIRYGHVRCKTSHAALWHWTGKPFPQPPVTLHLSDLQSRALSYPQQLARVGLSEEITRRLEGAPRHD